MAAFAQRLTSLRESKDLKKKELAEILNVSSSSISQYESGTNMPGYDILCRLSEYFDVSIDFLLGNDTITDSISLEDCFYNGVTYQELLVACHSLSNSGKQAVLAVVKALQEKNK